MKLLIKGGRVIDPTQDLDRVADILVENGRIASLGEIEKNSLDVTIDASGKIVMPGIVDMHVHLREPGREDKETVATGTYAALKGGVTACVAMPNTQPAIDCPEHVQLLKSIIEKEAVADVFIAGCITKGRQGKALTDFISLKKSGVIALSDDGASVDCQELMRQALAEAKSAGLLVIAHCEDKALAKEGVVNLGFTSTRLGLRGISNASEYKRVERDIKLAEETGASLHVAHVSCKESVALIAQAKQKGIKVTAETAPHYFALTEEAVLGYDTNMKMNPPLRSDEDVQAIKEALANGTIDAIASDHAPHTESEKDVEFARAEFGVVGLETILSVSITALIENGVLGWKGLVEKLASNPARILGVQAGTLCVGAAADIIIVSPEKSWRVEKKSLVSKSKNSAFLGKTLQGVVEYTIYKGKVVYRAQD